MADATTTIIGKAKQAISKGWIKGAPTDGQGAFCIEGAICFAAGASTGDMQSLDPQTFVEVKLAMKRLAEQLPSHWCQSLPPGPRLATWNDDSRVTQSDILALLEQALNAKPESQREPETICRS